MSETVQTYTFIIIGVVGGLFFIVLILVFCLYKRHVKLLNKVQSMQSNSPSFSMGGNFVVEYGRNKPISDFYVISSVLLGRGSSAEVVMGTSKKSHHRYAIKVVDLSKHGILWRYEKEKEILKDVDHTNIVRLFEVYNSMKAQFFVMELCTGGHLGNLLRDRPDGKLDEETARAYLLQLCRAISHCHQRGICHRDIKLQNILLESNSVGAQIKLVDFGNSARFAGKTPFTKIVGTTYTAAPEVFRQCYDEKCDIWSTGVVAFILLSGKRPFESNSVDAKEREKGIIMSILMGNYNFLDESWDDISPIAVHFVQCCMEDCKKRRSAIEILDHPFLVYADILSLEQQESKTLSALLTDRLLKNVYYSGLMRVSMLAIAFTLSSKKLQTLRLIFQSIDVLGTGNITRSMFHTTLQNNSKIELDTAFLDHVFDTVDQDCDDSISFIEFVAATIDPATITNKELRAAFTLLDNGEKGYLLQDDLKRVLLTSNASNPFEGNKQRRLSMQDKVETILKFIDELFVHADLDKDGKINYTEFLFAVAEKAPVKGSNFAKSAASARSTLAIIGKQSGETLCSTEDNNLQVGKKKYRNRRQSDSILSLTGNYQRRLSAIRPIKEKSRRGSVISDLYNIIVMPRDEIARRSKLLSAVEQVDDSPEDNGGDVVGPLSHIDGVSIFRKRRNTSPDTFLEGLRRQSVSFLKGIVALPNLSNMASFTVNDDSSDSNSADFTPDFSVQDVMLGVSATTLIPVTHNNGKDDDDVEKGLGRSSFRSYDDFGVSEINRESVRIVPANGATEADASLLADLIISSLTTEALPTLTDNVAHNGIFKSDDCLSIHNSSRDGTFSSNNASFGNNSF